MSPRFSSWYVSGFAFFPLYPVFGCTLFQLFVLPLYLVLFLRFLFFSGFYGFWIIQFLLFKDRLPPRVFCVWVLDNFLPRCYTVYV